MLAWDLKVTCLEQFTNIFHRFHQHLLRTHGLSGRSTIGNRIVIKLMNIRIEVTCTTAAIEEDEEAIDEREELNDNSEQLNHNSEEPIDEREELN